MMTIVRDSHKCDLHGTKTRIATQGNSDDNMMQEKKWQRVDNCEKDHAVMHIVCTVRAV